MEPIFWHSNDSEWHDIAKLMKIAVLSQSFGHWRNGRLSKFNGKARIDCERTRSTKLPFPDQADAYDAIKVSAV
jgi:hypothetical protein